MSDPMRFRFMAGVRFMPSALAPVGLVMLLAFGAVFVGLLPLTMPFGLAAGGVLETGQAEPARWWLGVAGAIGLYLFVSRKWTRPCRLWWLATLVAAILLAVFAFVHVASSGQPGGRNGRTVYSATAPAPPPMIGLLTALPLFWPEGRGVEDILAGTRDGAVPPVITRYPARAIDHVDAEALRGIGTLLIAQPRLLQPEELVAIDRWARGGGKLLIFADPLLIWPSDLPPGDVRRPPLTSLLDPLLAHWGLRLEPAGARSAVERRMLATGHVVMLAGASRFSLVPGVEAAARCRLAEQGLMALCRVGQGEARLVADADLLDDRLWLADPAHSHRAEAWSADVPALVDAWLARPLEAPLIAAPRRVAGEAALVPAMRAALGVIFLIGVLGWVGSAPWFCRQMSRIGKVKRTEEEQSFGETKK